MVVGVEEVGGGGVGNYFITILAFLLSIVLPLCLVYVSDRGSQRDGDRCR